MSIEKHATEAFVLASFDNGEHDKMFRLFTRDFGMLLAKATSIRKNESKLRAHLHVGRLSRVTLVKGKEIWRIVGSEELSGRDSFTTEMTKLLDRFIKGDGSQKKLFDHAYGLATKEGLEERNKRLLAYYLILADLGYADVSMIGAENPKEYRSWDIDQLYTQLILSKDVVRPHVTSVLKDMQL